MRNAAAIPGSSRRALVGATVAGAALALQACSAPVLTPASGVVPASAVSGSQAEQLGISEAEGVTVQLDAAPWRQRPEVLRFTMPLYVRVYNGGASPVLIRHRSFHLVDGDSETHRARPVSVISGKLDRTHPGAPGFRPNVQVAVGNPRATGLGTFSDPAVTVTVPRSSGYFESGWTPPGRGQGWITYLRERALPEGTVYPGERVEGYLYFEPSSRGGELTSLVAEIDRHERAGSRITLNVPFPR